MTGVELDCNCSFSGVEWDIVCVLLDSQRAIVDLDWDLFEDVFDDSFVLVHMSGKRESRDEFLSDLAGGVLNYYRSVVVNPVISIEGSCAVVDCDVVLDAKVYGIGGSWTLHSSFSLVCVGGRWLITCWDN